jgi:hypothetical protein
MAGFRFQIPEYVVHSPLNAFVSWWFETAGLDETQSVQPDDQASNTSRSNFRLEENIVH